MFATLVFGLTVGMIGVHVGEWVLLGKMMGGSGGEPGKGSGLSQVMGLMNLLRFEAVYYVVLLAFWWLNREVVPGWAVLSLGVAHIGGWAALERKKPKVEGAASGGLRKVLSGIAVFDAVEVVILVYLAWRLWPE